MFCSAASSTRWLKRRSADASPTIAATASRSPASRLAASSSTRAEAEPSTAASSRSTWASTRPGTAPGPSMPCSSCATRSRGRNLSPASRRVCASRPRMARRGVSRRRIATRTVARVPRNRLAPTARPSRLHPVSPNSPSGDSQRQPKGPSCNQATGTPRSSIMVGSSSTHAHTVKPTTTPVVAARAGVCGRHTAKASAGASVASAENDTAPTSASASLPATMRL